MPQSWKNRFLTTVEALHGRPLLRFFASRLPDAADAPDMIQEVYLRLLRLNRPDLIRSPEAYLYTIAANIVREQRLKRVTRPPHVSLDDAPGRIAHGRRSVFSRHPGARRGMRGSP